MQGKGLLGPWELYRKIGLGLVALVVVALVVLVNLPLGFAALLGLFLASRVWKGLAMTNPMLGTYYVGTPSYKVAVFFEALRAQTPSVFQPVVCLGAGPPSEDPDHELEPGWWPASRLAAWWSAAAAVAPALLEIPLVPLHLPLWGPPLPWLVTVPLSFVGFYATAQVVAHVRRAQGDPESVAAVEPRPATMLSKARADLPLRDLATRSASFGAVPAVLLVILGAGTPLPWLVALPLAAVSMVLVGLVTASRMLGQAYVAGWAERSERRDFWMSAFMFMKDRAPTLLNEAGLPTEQEWQQTRGGAVGSFDAPPEPEGPPPTLKERVLGAPAALLGVVRAVLGLPGALLSKVRRRPSDDVDPAQFMDDEDERDLDELDEDDELDDGFGGPGAYDPYATPGAFDDGPGADEPYAPEVKVATFLYPPNSVFSDYQSEAHRVRGALGVDLCAFSPIGSFVNEAEAPGTVGAQGFRVWWTEQEIPDLLTPDLGHWMREFLVRALVIPGLSEIKGIGWCQLVSCGMVTRPESGKTVVKADVVPPAGVSLETFLQSLPQIQTVLGVPWARAGRGAGRGAGGSITLFFGEYPTPDDTRFINPASIVRKQIDQMDWAYYFQTQKLTGVTGVPKLVERRPTTKTVDKLVFELPDGLAYEEVAGRVAPLKTTSGNEFMEIEPGAELDTRRMGMVQRAKAEAEQGAKFTMVAAKHDPLKRVFDFGDYRDKLLTGRTPGQEKIHWSPGVLADDQLAEYAFDDELPHLLVAGSSGGGKSNWCSILVRTLHADHDEVKRDLSSATQSGLHPDGGPTDHLRMTASADQPVATRIGSKTLGEVEVGDVLLDIDGRPTTVVHAYDPVVPESAYDVVLSDGSTVRASGDHLWSVLPATERYRAAAARDRAQARELRAEDVREQVSRLRALANVLQAQDTRDPLDLSAQPTPLEPGRAYVRTAAPRSPAEVESTPWRPAEAWRAEVDSEADWGVEPDRRLALLALPPQVWGLLVGAAKKPDTASQHVYVRDGAALVATLRAWGVDAVDHGRKAGYFDHVVLHDGVSRLVELALGDLTLDQAVDALLAAHPGQDAARAALLGALIGYASDDGRLLVKQVRVDVIRRLAAAAEVDVKAEAPFQRSQAVTLPGFDPSSVEMSPRADDYAYVSGVALVSSSDHVRTSPSFTFDDPQLRSELLARGFIVAPNRVQNGRARCVVGGLAGSASAEPYLHAWTPTPVLDDEHAAWQYVLGWARVGGSRTAPGQVRLTAALDRVDETTALRVLGRAGLEGLVGVEGDLLVVDLALPDEMPVADSRYETVARAARQEVRYDDRGRRVLSVPELEGLTSAPRALLDDLIADEGIAPTGHWHAPTLQRYGAQSLLKASLDIPLYPAELVVRHLANLVAAREPAVEVMHPELVVLSTEEMRASLYDGPTGAANYALPVNALDLPKQPDPLPVPAYVLGAWLGDGFSNSGEVCGEDDGVFEQIEAEGYAADQTRRPEGYTNDFRVVRFVRRDDERLLRHELRDLGMLGRGLKRIPESYQAASFEDRLSLLQGLMDTDGTVSADSGKCELALSKADLFDDAVRLIRGLGVKVHTAVRELSQDNPAHADSHRASFFTTLPVFRLARKAERLPTEVSERARLRYVVEIRPVEVGPDDLYRCISVDSPTHTYLVGEGLVPTHNSVVINSMLVQLVHNNGPSEMRLWMIEPKNELQTFKDLDVCERFIDSWTPNDRFVENATVFMQDAVAEMNRRYRLMKDHPKFPKKLEKAREIARREAARDGTPVEDHPLFMPFILIVVEECATLFADPGSKEERAQQEKLLSATAEIARKARAAGMYLICITQYPTNASIPSVIRNQMRRVGLMCQNRLASEIVIGENGLETFKTKGMGKVSHKGTYRTFRGFWVKDGDPEEGEPNDVLDVVSALPGGGGGQQGAGGQVVPEVVMPDVGDAVFTLWEQSSVGRAVGRAVDEGKKTKDTGNGGSANGGSNGSASKKRSTPNNPFGSKNDVVVPS